MKRIGDASFFRVIDRLFGTTAKDAHTVEWTIDGVTCRRERHSYAGPHYSFAVEATTCTKAAQPDWTMIVVKEYWWKGSRREVIKSQQWANLVSGRRADLMAWMNRQKTTLDQAE